MSDQQVSDQVRIRYSSRGINASKHSDQKPIQISGLRDCTFAYRMLKQKEHVISEVHAQPSGACIFLGLFLICTGIFLVSTTIQPPYSSTLAPPYSCVHSLHTVLLKFYIY